MASYPVEAADTSGLVDAVNNLLSGPGGLGQDFSGFTSYVPGFATGAFRTPYVSPGIQTTGTTVNGAFTVLLNASFDAGQLQVGQAVRTQGPGVAVGAVITIIGATTTAGTVITLDLANTGDYDGVVTFLAFPIPRLYVQAINLSTSQMLSGDTFEFTFAAPQTPPPFVNGQLVTVSGLSSTYNGTYSPIGVVSCSTTKVVCRTRTIFTVIPPESGGNISYEFTSQGSYGGSGYDMSTDCNSKVVVTGGTDRVFVAGQLVNKISYTATTPSDLIYIVKITRYIGSPNTNLVNPGFSFDVDEIVASIEYEYLALNGTGTLPVVDTVFSTLVDAEIAPGYYWYILDINFYNTTGDLQVTTCELAQRSFTAQVVKQ
jgi:hypothetical protein